MDLTVLYRGPLSSCDYDCPYCPFAKRRDSREQLRADRAALERFAGWAAAQTGDRLSVLFTPWGEGLVRSWYRRTLTELSHLPHIRRVAIQTNLSCRTDWLAEASTRPSPCGAPTIPARLLMTGSSASAWIWFAGRSVSAWASSASLSIWRRRAGSAPICPATSICG